MYFVFFLPGGKVTMKKVWIEFKKSMEDHNLMIQVIQLVLILALLFLCVTS